MAKKTTEKTKIQKPPVNQQHMETKTPPVEVETPTVKVETPPVEVETPPIEVETPPVEIEAPPAVAPPIGVGKKHTKKALEIMQKHNLQEVFYVNGYFFSKREKAENAAKRLESKLETYKK
jgi:hypothetical protein